MPSSSEGGRSNHWLAFARRKAKLEWPQRPAPTEKFLVQKRRMAKGGVLENLPRDAPQYGPDGVNIAIMEKEQLASDPLAFRLDRHGKLIKEGDEVKTDIPWSYREAGGLKSAAAPMSWEEFEARYKQMDKPQEISIGERGLGELRARIAAEDGKDDYRTVRTFSWPISEGEQPTSVMLIGVAETSERSRRLAARAVFETEPTGLLVQLCRERVGRYLVMPAQHCAAAANYARGFTVQNPHQMRRILHTVDQINGDYEALKMWMSDLAYAAAVDEFAQQPSSGSMPKTLCLGDVRHSRLEAVRKQHGNDTAQEIPFRSARGKQIARGLTALAMAGHKKVLGIVDVDLLATVTTWLERVGAQLVAVADSSDIETGRESLSNDMQMGMQYQPKPRYKEVQQAPFTMGFGGRIAGAFLNDQGLQMLRRRKEFLLKLTRVSDLVRHREPNKVWKVAELLGGGGPTPGPGALLKDPDGLMFEFGMLEIPEHYLREAGMEAYAPVLWKSLLDKDAALEARDAAQLMWWAAESSPRPEAVDAEEVDSDFDDPYVF